MAACAGKIEEAISLATKAGQLITVGNQVLIERAQTVGPGTINRNATKVYECGNYFGVATVFDIPDLSWTLQSYDASAATEALLTNTTATAHVPIDLAANIPIDVLGEFKKGRTDSAPYDVSQSIVTPYLTLESMSYKYGVSALAEQTATLKGDSIFYTPGSAYTQEFVGTNAINQSCAVTHEAYQYNGDVLTGTRYALGVSLSNGTRLRYGVDYTETVGTVTSGHATLTVVILAAVPSTEKIRICYSSNTVANYPQSVHTIDSIVKPAAIRGYQIEVYVGALLTGSTGADAVDPSKLWISVQAVTADWKVTLDKNEEFGNTQVVSQDFDVPAVSGTIQIRPRNVAEMIQRARQAGGVATATEVAGALNTATVPIVIRLTSPIDGSILKDLYIPDALLTVPPVSGAANKKLEYTFPFESNQGFFYVVPEGLVQA